MRRILNLVCLGTFFFVASEVNAVSIGVGDFSGAETVVDLSFLPGPSEPVVTVGDLVFTSSANFLKQSSLTEASLAGSFTMDLASPQLRVGLELTAFASATQNVPVTWSIEALDAGATSLETILVSQAAAGDTVFGGIERPELIAQLVVTEVTPHPSGGNYFTFINNVRYEVPEPTGMLLLVVGMCVPLLVRSHG